MKILVLGSGGREHAIIWTLRRTSSAPLDLYCAPGNGGISQLAKTVAISPMDHSELIRFVETERIGLTIVGPEAPLAAGVVDALESQGHAMIGPSKAASCLESSKATAKDFMARHRIPTARYRVADSSGAAIEFLRSGEFGQADNPVVIKADGLAAGKGVIVAGSRFEAQRAVEKLTSGEIISTEAAQRIVIEEALQGTEASVLVFADGRDYVVMPPARDHKRVGENDTGPNTGGMGAITDLSIMNESTLSQVVHKVIEPTLEGAHADGFTFRGILFVGLMLTTEGPKVLEYNVRFGDPEAQAILVRLESDLLSVFEAVTSGSLRNLHVKWRHGASACVVLASGGYPGQYRTGFKIQGLSGPGPNQVQVFHSGTSITDQGDFLTAGGRVLGITATGETLSEALSRCYAATEDISWEGMQYRGDIGRFRKAGSAE